MADDREPVRSCLDRGGASADDGRDDSILGPIDIARVLIADAKAEIGREFAHSGYEAKQRPRLQRNLWIGDHALDGLARPQDLQLARRQMAVIATARQLAEEK